MTQPELSVVVPCFNEEATIAMVASAVLAECRERRWQLIVVDDGSTDRSVDRLQPLLAPDWQLIRHGRNRGYGAAVKSGIRAADGAWVVTFDADGQHQRQPEAEIEHDGEHDQHDRARLDKGGNGLGDELAQRVDFVGVKSHDIAVLVSVEVADGEILHPAEHLLTELVEKALRHIGHELLLNKDGEDGEHIQHDEQR